MYNIMDNNLIEKSDKNSEKINGLKTQFFSALDDYKKYYVYYNKNPEVDEFQNYYANSKSQLQTMSRNVVLQTNEIDNDIETLDAEMDVISEKLEREKKLNIKLTRILNNLQNTQNGSEILIDDAKELYNTQYRYNWELFIGILMISGVIFKLMKPPISPVN
jgi:hypothetical protein